MTKVYSYPGLTAAVIAIPVGRTSLKVEFSKGYLDKKLNRPAIYSTSDRTEQLMIEQSPLFGSRIFLHRVYGEPEPVAKTAPEASSTDAKVEAENAGVQGNAPTAETVSYPGVTTYEEAVAVLKGIEGVKAAQLRSRAGAERVATSLGVVFPNFTF